jgi:sulfoxide reductase heme-binding subunit YedZ
MTDETKAIPLWLFALNVAVLSIANVTLWAIYGDGEPAIRAYTTWTARISFIFFTGAFLASAAAYQWPNKVTQWCLRNRRYWGLNFALAHIVHFGALSMVIILTEVEPSIITIVFGGLAYLFVVLMALTSNDKSQQLLGKGWNRLHTVGGYYIWAIFAYTFAGGIFESRVSALYLLLAMASIGLKLKDKTTAKAEA